MSEFERQCTADRWRKIMRSRACVYFVRSGSSGPIKIGYTDRPLTERVYQLQIGNPEPLHLIGVISAAPDEEKILHRRFRSARIRGEWFEPTEDLLTFVREEAQSAAERPMREHTWAPDIYRARYRCPCGARGRKSLETGEIMQISGPGVCNAERE